MRRTTSIALSSVSFAALAILAAPASAQTPDPVNPGGDPCQAPAGQVDKAQCPDTANQDTPDAATATDVAPQQADGGDAIVVTGSRIRRNRFNTADPVTLITRDEATQAGFSSTAEILQSTAVTGGTAQINDTYGGLVTDGGPGANTISLRGLGATRTLVLLNGRRVAPAGSRGSVGSADLNVLPNSIIDRIEVLNTGASSIYGSDAVAGVINIVTRNKINGLTVEMQHNFPELGAGESKRYSVVAGTSGERFSVQGSFEYYKRNRLTLGDVPSLTCGTERYADGSDFIDPNTGEPKCFPLDEGGVTVNTIGTGAYAGNTVATAPGVPAGYAGTCNRFRPNPAVTTGLLPGFECVGGGSLSTNIRDTSSAATLAQDVISPAEIYTAYLSGNYETGILGDATLYAEVLFNRRKSNQNGQRQFTIDYAPGSPLIPAVLAARPLNSTIGVRVFADYGIYQSRQQQDFTKASAGLRGELPLNDWRYDLYASKSWSDADYTTDLILADRLAQSLDVVPDGAGGFRCRVTVGGCVAAPAITADVIGGNFPADWFDYVVDPVTGNTKYNETTYSATVDGPLFPIWGGDVSLAVGAEYRKAKIDDTPSPESVRGNLYNFTGSTPTRGSDSVWEVFGELEVPVLRNVPFAEELTLNASARRTHYKSYGGQTTYKVGGLYSPFKFLSFRGSYGTSYRAPALFEQFLGGTSGFLASNTDPCDQLASETNPLVLERCLAEGLPANFQQNNGVTVIGLGGAEAGLEAETSKNLTFGTVLQHDFGRAIGSFSLAVDYFDIEVNNGVSQLSAAAILSQCYENPQRTLCDTPFITRTPYTGPGTGQLTVVQSYLNIATSKAKGIDFVGRYSRELGPGRFRLGAQLTRMLKRYDQTLPTDDIVDLVGLTANPKWAGAFDAAYETGPWNFRYGVEYISKTDDAKYLEQFGYTPDVYDYSVPNYFLHSASIRYETDAFGITFGARNLFDKDPPKITTLNPLVNTVSNVPIQGGYDFRGRTFFVNVRAGLDKIGQSLGF